MNTDHLVLQIDSTSKGEVRFALSRKKKVWKKYEKSSEKLSEELLLHLKNFLTANKAKLHDLEKIVVNPGPGPFSSVRTGVAVANALSFALGIPIAINGSKKDVKMVLPVYDRAPNITKPKSRK